MTTTKYIYIIYYIIYVCKIISITNKFSVDTVDKYNLKIKKSYNIN